ncbi:hypothetical protein B484DRAFT_437545, partial [Ochromonadaceae sp. CCMP2298]
MDPVAKRIGRLRALVGVMLTAAALFVGFVTYIKLSHTESSSAKDRFASIVEAAASKLDHNFLKMDDALRLLAQAYAESNPSLSDWPTAVLPSFRNSARLVRQIAGADTIAFAPLVKLQDLSRYEEFIFDYWDSDPLIPAEAGYYSAAGLRGVWSLNDTSNGLVRSSSTPFHDTTGKTTWGENRRIMPVSQVLFKDKSPSNWLGFNTYASAQEGEATDRVVRCVEDSSFSTAADKCGATTQLSASSDSQDFLVRTDTALQYVNSHQFVPIVVGNSSQHEFVGGVAGQYRYRGFTFTCRIEEGVAEIVGGSAVAGYGDVASRRYAQYK